MSEYLLTGIAISIAASLVADGCAGATKGLYGIHSGRTLRTIIVCENLWVIAVLGAQAVAVYLAFWAVGTKDFVLICVVFVLMLPSLSWIYTRTEAVVAGAIGRSPDSVE